MSLADIAQVVSASAAVIALIIGIAGASLAYFQIKSNARLARENTAIEAHRQLLCLCIERPELSSSSLMLKHLNRKDFHGILGELGDESERELWFLSYVLNTMEQILESNAGDEAWENTMAAQVDYHRDLLEEVWPGWISHYGETLRKFMDRELTAAS